jgi:hypothetical protein
MHSEKRRERRAVYTHQPKGKLQVLQGEQRLDVYAVKDASQSGLQLEVGSKVNTGENILVRYWSDEVDIKLNGTVMWSSTRPSESKERESLPNCVLGVRLASPSLLQTFW